MTSFRLRRPSIGDIGDALLFTFVFAVLAYLWLTSELRAETLHPVVAQAIDPAQLLALVPPGWLRWCLLAWVIASTLVTLCSHFANYVSPTSRIGKVIHIIARNGPGIRDAIEAKAKLDELAQKDGVVALPPAGSLP